MLVLQSNRTSCKRPPKMQRLGGRLRGVVVYESRTARAKFYSKRFQFKVLTENIFGDWEGGHLWEVVARGGLTVFCYR